jgi:hypothetical protein
MPHFIMGREHGRATDLVSEFICASARISDLNILYSYDREIEDQLLSYLKLVVCILLHVLGQVQGFRLMQHCFEELFSILFDNRFGHMTMVIRPKRVTVIK